MATAQTVQPTSEASVPFPTRIGWGMLWAGFMTMLVVLWAARKYEMPIITAAIALAGVAYLILGLWLLITHWRGISETQTQRQRTLLPAGLVALGVLLAACGVFFLWSRGLQALGEGVGLVLFGITSVVAGRRLAIPKTENSSRLLQGVQDHPKTMGQMLLTLAAGLIAVYWGLYLTRLVSSSIFPEMFGLCLLVLTYSGIGMYLFRSAGPLTSAEARIIVLLGGGLSGFALFLTVLLRTYAWRDTTLFGGLAAWQGPFSWRIWLCAYLGMLSLALLSGSLLLARADIRTSPVLRRVFFGYNTAVTVLLLILVLALANVVVYVLFPYQFDWTSERGIYSISENSKRLLHNLDRKVTAYGLFARAADYHELISLLENCETEAPNQFEFKHLSLDADTTEYKELSERFPAVFQNVPRFGAVQRRGGVLLVYGELPSDPKKPAPHAFIALNEVYKSNARERKKDEPLTQEFMGEVELMKQLSGFTTEKRSRVYFLQGNGEALIDPQERFIRLDRFHEPLTEQGAGNFKRYLTAQKYEVFGLSFLAPPKTGAEPGMVYAPENPKTKAKEVPKDAGFLIAVAPHKPYTPEALAAVESFLERGGKLLVCFDVFLDREYTQFISTGLEEIVRKYGIEVTNEVVFTPDNRYFEAEASIPVRPTSELAMAFKDRELGMVTPRLLRVGPPGKFDVEVLLEVGPMVLIESNPGTLKSPLKHMAALDKAKTLESHLTRSRLPVAMSSKPSGAKDAKPQVYVFGDADFITDGLLKMLEDQQRFLEAQGMKGPDQLGLHLEWGHSPIAFSSEQPTFIGPRPRKITSFRPGADTNYGAMALVPGWIMTITLFGLGAGIWIVRRR